MTEAQGHLLDCEIENIQEYVASDRVRYTGIGTRYIICKAPNKMKMQGPFFKNGIKSFKMTIEEHWTKYRALLTAELYDHMDCMPIKLALPRAQSLSPGPLCLSTSWFCQVPPDPLPAHTLQCSRGKGLSEFTQLRLPDQLYPQRAQACSPPAHWLAWYVDYGLSSSPQKQPLPWGLVRRGFLKEVLSGKLGSRTGKGRKLSKDVSARRGPQREGPCLILQGALECEWCLRVGCTWDKEAGISVLPVWAPQSLIKGHSPCGCGMSSSRALLALCGMDNMGPSRLWADFRERNSSASFWRLTPKWREASHNGTGNLRCGQSTALDSMTSQHMDPTCGWPEKILSIWPQSSTGNIPVWSFQPVNQEVPGAGRVVIRRWCVFLSFYLP